MFGSQHLAAAIRRENDYREAYMEEIFGLQDYSDREPVRSRDVVCGKVVEEQSAPAKMEYDGEMLYFCSAACKQSFEEEPSRYIGQRVKAALRPPR